MTRRSFQQQIKDVRPPACRRRVRQIQLLLPSLRRKPTTIMTSEETVGLVSLYKTRRLFLWWVSCKRKSIWEHEVSRGDVFSFPSTLRKQVEVVVIHQPSVSVNFYSKSGRARFHSAFRIVAFHIVKFPSLPPQNESHTCNSVRNLVTAAYCRILRARSIVWEKNRTRNSSQKVLSRKAVIHSVTL